MSTGVVKFYNKTKAFGFIIDDETGDEIFVHVSGIKSKADLNENDKVSFEIQEGKKGLNAVKVERV